ncbi:cyc2-like cyclin, putative [Leishmania tarentolae]|uniref:Cyc2-like cyclin, putative n=1 Tax=Leishmania tarentolae TaxID=5689 RepID=A0A640KQM5_LEITA|nr:cyc2-like cyclin, putative [Leishmania tarentolae]
MISIPVMTDETVVRYHSSMNGSGAVAEDNGDYQTAADAAGRCDGNEEATAAAAPPISMNYYGQSIPSSPSSPVRGGGVFSVPAQYSAAVPCSCSILDVGPEPAPIAAPVDLAPPEMPPLAQLCALALQHRCDLSEEVDQNIRSCFHSSRVPSISLWDYVRRFAKYSVCSEECFILAMVLMDRYVCKTRIPITLRNVHRLYITAMTLSVKLRDDSYYSNAYYASIGGVVNAELNVLELELLDIVQWFTWVEKSVYDAYVGRLTALFGDAMPKRIVPSPTK